MPCPPVPSRHALSRAADWLQEAYGERGMGCSTTKATKGQRVGCIVPPGEPVELLVEYIERGF